MLFYNFQMAVRSIFSEFETFDVRFEISVLKDIKMVGVVIALPKNGDHSPAYRSNSARHYA